MNSRTKRAVLASATTMMAASLAVVPASPASASVSYGKRSISKFGCIGKLDIDHRGKGRWYARGRFYTNPDWNTVCRVKLQRRKGSGGWKNISYVGSISNDHKRYSTGWHWDSDPYSSRVCLEYITQDRWYCSASY
jgi:hypothetical protein